MKRFFAFLLSLVVAAIFYLYLEKHGRQQPDLDRVITFDYYTIVVKEGVSVSEFRRTSPDHADPEWFIHHPQVESVQWIVPGPVAGSCFFSYWDCSGGFIAMDELVFER